MGAAALLCAGCGSVEDGYQWVVSSVGIDAESAQRAQARKTLDALVDAYQSRNIMGFMKWVSPDYPFAPALLESQLSRSFTQYFYIEIMYDLSSVVPSADEKTLSVNINFRRKLGLTRTGQLLSDDGSTNLLLQKRGNAYVLLQQHAPALFK